MLSYPTVKENCRLPRRRHHWYLTPPAKFGFNFAPPFLYLKSTTFPKVGVCFRQTEISIRFHFTQFKLVSRKTLKMIVTVLYGFLFLAVVIFLTNEADKLS